MSWTHWRRHIWRDDAYLLDMLLAARKALEFTRGMNRERFLANEMAQQAVMRLVQAIGEAARQLSAPFKEGHPGIPWSAIVVMRHRLVHEYFRIRAAEMWLVIERDLPNLIPQIELLVNLDEQS